MEKVDPTQTQKRLWISRRGPANDHPPEEVTVLVFQKNRLSRTFQLPLSLVSRLGWTLAFASILIGISSFYTLRYFRLSGQIALSGSHPISQPNEPASLTNAQPSQDVLQKKNAELQEQLDALKKQMASMQSSVPTGSPSVVPDLAQPASPPAGMENAIPSLTSKSPPQLFSALPKTLMDSGLTPSPSISLQNPRIAWKGKALKVHFNLGYIKGDGGNQQGRIVLLARGKSTLLSYPDSVLDNAGTANLIKPEAGEYFSVSRFREVRAEFVVAKGAAALDAVEVLIFGYEEGQLKILIHQVLFPAASSLPPQAAEDEVSP
jgi:hypothetical protein